MSKYTPGMRKFLIFVGIVIIIGTVGWVKNIIGIFKCDFKAPYKAEVIRIAGVPVAPLGAICGFLDLGE